MDTICTHSRAIITLEAQPQAISQIWHSSYEKDVKRQALRHPTLHIPKLQLKLAQWCRQADAGNSIHTMLHSPRGDSTAWPRDCVQGPRLLTAEPDPGVYVGGRWGHPENILNVTASAVTISSKYRSLKAQINKQASGKTCKHFSFLTSKTVPTCTAFIYWMYNYFYSWNLGFQPYTTKTQQQINSTSKMYLYIQSLTHMYE